MPGRNKNKELIKEIKEGNEEILLYLFRKHYVDLKSIFESFDINEREIPGRAAAVVVKIWMEIHQNNFSENIDLISYLLNTAKENAEKLAAEKKAEKKNKLKDIITDKENPQDVVAECVNVLDASSRKALQWYYAEKQNIEQVAGKLNMDTSAVSDFINKAFVQLSSIVKIRMEYV